MTFIIKAHRKVSSENLHCSDCEKEIKDPSFWNIDGHVVCDECRDNEEYFGLVKCTTVGCDFYDEPGACTDGLCEACREVQSPSEPPADGSDG